MFPGLFPGRGSIQHPRGLSPQRGEQSESSFAAAAEQFLEDADLETSTNKAMEEWTAILEAFNLFKDSLGADFQPMGPDVHPQRDSPFGPAWTYRTLPIAGVWMNFYMGLVILHRAHPIMPPFAMVAAHMCARETQPYANEIGKIVAGVSDDWGAETMVSTLVGAAYIECCFPLFVGAVQVRRPFSFPSPSAPAERGKEISPGYIISPDTTVQRQTTATMGDPPPARHHAADGVEDGQPDRQRVRGRVAQGGGDGPRAGV